MSDCYKSTQKIEKQFFLQKVIDGCEAAKLPNLRYDNY